MLKDLEHFFTKKGMYVGTHTFMSINLEGGFEAFSGHATETWEYRWVVNIFENKIINVPNILVKGRQYESIDDVCKTALKDRKSVV